MMHIALTRLLIGVNEKFVIPLQLAPMVDCGTAGTTRPPAPPTVPEPYYLHPPGLHQQRQDDDQGSGDSLAVRFTGDCSVGGGVDVVFVVVCVFTGNFWDLQLGGIRISSSLPQY